MTSQQMPNTDQPLIPRLPSGIPGLDPILRGGFPLGGMYFIVGAPGTGKTILGNQLCFHHAASGGRAVYLTLLVASYDIMLVSLQSLAFFDPAVVGRSLHYFSGYGDLTEGGVPALLKRLQQIMRHHRPTVLVVDGFASIDACATSVLERQRFIGQLQMLGTSYGCTIIVLSHQLYEQFGEGIIELHDVLVEQRAVRELRVRKMRGAVELRGTHLFEISEAGMVVYPRTETLLAPLQEDATGATQPLTFDIPSLDAMLNGGLQTGSATMLLGTPGSGKTLLGLHFLAAGARRGEAGLYLGFAESPGKLVQKAQQVGLNLAKYSTAERVTFMWHPPFDDILDKLVANLLHHVEERQIRRVCIDGLEGLQAAAVYRDRFPRVLTALLQTLQARGVTTIFTLQSSDPGSIGMQQLDHGAATVAANIIVTRHVEIQAQVRLLIAILKMQQSSYDSTIRELRITAQGIMVADAIPGAEALLSRLGHPRSVESASH